MGRMMLVASALGMLFTTVGLVISYIADLPSGASIILVAGTSYLFSTLFNQLMQRHYQGQKAS
jgi:zinc transport system permease protein